MYRQFEMLTVKIPIIILGIVGFSVPREDIIIRVPKTIPNDS
jgi:hypothetical protein